MNKLILVLGFALTSINVHAQTVKEFQAALLDKEKGIRAIHKYPKDIKNGQCHWVEVTSIRVAGDSIKIVETWTYFSGSKKNTVLNGKITNGIASGKWNSTAGSSGQWSYNFATNTGKWNKTESLFGTFKDWETLEFKILSKNQIKDGMYDCY